MYGQRKVNPHTAVVWLYSEVYRVCVCVLGGGMMIG